MNLPPHAQDLPAGVPLYFASFAGYALPVAPVGPMDYATAERGAAFSVFVFDARRRVVTFEKWRVFRERWDAPAGATAGLGAGAHFFPASEDGSADLRVELSLAQTEGLTCYFRVVIDATGAAQFERVRRERMIRHAYTYWENDRLREMRYETGPGASGVERFDQGG